MRGLISQARGQAGAYKITYWPGQTEFLHNMPLSFKQHYPTNEIIHKVHLVMQRFPFHIIFDIHRIENNNSIYQFLHNYVHKH